MVALNKIRHPILRWWWIFATCISVVAIGYDYDAIDDICDDTSFLCRDGFCLQHEFVCDGVDDCQAGEDEFSCNASCLPGEFSCADRTMCISGRFKCDGDADCIDSSDETNCNTTVECNAEAEEFRCQNGLHCIPKDSVCDGELDCMDKSDENNCESFSCGPGKFKCGNTTECIPNDWKCDGFEDCDDALDENCSTKVLECKTFVCDDKSDCLEISQVCDGQVNCEDGSDEVDSCYNKCRQLNCSHGCTLGGSGVTCVCPKGYSSLTNTTCQDVNECEDHQQDNFGKRPACSQTCINTNGSFHCRCVAPYVLEPDRRSCRVPLPAPIILLSLSSEIRKYSLLKQAGDYDLVQDGLYFVEDMDVDCSNRKLFFTDARLGKVFSSGVAGKKLETGRPVHVNVGLVSPKGLSFNWHSRLLYIVDSFQGIIVACAVDGQDCAVVVEGLDDRDPEDVLVDPKFKHIYWTENNHPVNIMRSNLDGTKKGVYLSTHMVHPDHLLIDYPTSSLYWVDTRIRAVFRLPLDAPPDQRSNLQQIVISYDIKHPTALAIIEDSLMWAERKSRSIMKANKWTGKNRRRILKEEKQVKAAVILHPALQPNMGDNVCWRAECSSLCVESDNERGYVCLCPPEMILLKDGITCEWDEWKPFLLIGTGNAIIQVPYYLIGHLNIRQLTAPGLWRVGTMASHPLTQEVFFSTLNRDGTPRICRSNRVWNSVFNYTVIEDRAEYLGYPVRLALDWIANQIFWLNSERNTIEIFKTDGNSRSRLTFKGVTKIKSFAIDVLKGLLFYCTWGDDAHVGMCKMDGTDCTKLVERNIVKPNHLLAHDGRLYWSDAFQGHISSISYSKNHRKKIIDLSSPRAFTVHKNLYFVDNKTESVHLAALMNQVYLTDYPFPQMEINDLTMLLPQTEVPDLPCSKDNGGCSDICLTLPDQLHCCLCPVGKTLDEDQRNCRSLENVCPKEHVFCESSARCVPKEGMCLGHVQCKIPTEFVDCAAHKPVDRDACPKGNECEHDCTLTPDGPQCSCDHGYVLDSDLHSCKDIDECAVRNGNCSQACHNTVGRYTCSCLPGYHLIGDKATCHSPDHDSAYLMVSTSNGIDFITMDGENKHALFVGPRYPEAFDVLVGSDWKNFVNTGLRLQIQSSDSEDATTVVWAETSAVNETSSKLYVFGASPVQVALEDKAVVVTVDQVTKNIYYVGQQGAAALFTLVVCDRRLRYCRTLLSDSGWLPASLAFHLPTRMMYWCDLKSMTIWRAFMDGTELRQVLSVVDSVVNGLTVDQVRDRLYWVQSTLPLQTATIHTSRLDGSDRYTVESSDQTSFLSVDIFEGFLYLTEGNAQRLQKISTFSSRPVLADIRAMDIHVKHVRVVHSALNLSNPCLSMTCSYLCVLSKVGARCLCPDNLLQNKSAACQDSSVPTPNPHPTTPKPAPPYLTTTTATSGRTSTRSNRIITPTVLPGPGGSSTTTLSPDQAACRTFCYNGGTCQLVDDVRVCLCDVGFAGERCQEQTTLSTEGPVATGDSTVSVDNNSTEVNGTVSVKDTDSLSAGAVAAIVICVIAAVIGALVAVVLYCRKKRSGTHAYATVEFRRESDEMSLMGGNGLASDLFYCKWDLDGSILYSSSSSSDSAIFSNCSSPDPIFRPVDPGNHPCQDDVMSWPPLSKKCTCSSTTKPR